MTEVGKMVTHIKKLHDEGRIESCELKNLGGEIIFFNDIPLRHSEGGYYEIKFLIRK